MTNTTDNLSVLASLRELVPSRPLRFAEGVITRTCGCTI
jgi:hypothetical protein